MAVGCPKSDKGDSATTSAGGKGGGGGNAAREGGASRASGGGGGGGASGVGRPGRGGGPQTVEAVALLRANVGTNVEVPVILEGRKQVEVFPRVGGRVQNLLKETGAKVTRGQTLFSIDRSEPGESFLPVPVTSPITGFVAQWYVSVGDQLSSGERALLVVDDAALRARVYLPVNEWQEVDLGTKVALRVGEVSKPARVANVARAVQASAGKGLVEVEIDNADGSWKAGFGATARIELAPRPRLVAPARALQLTNDGSFIYVLEGDKVRRRKVEFLARTPDEVELGGAGAPDDGTRVVVSGTSRLSDGATVKVAGEGQGEGKGEGKGKGGAGSGSGSPRGAAKETEAQR
jgi:multidrug efflux pump subunit AcrA (membrane-fusion protein)